MDAEIVALVEAVKALTEVIAAQQAQQCAPVATEEVARGIVAVRDVLHTQAVMMADMVSHITEHVASVLDPWKDNPYRADGAHLAPPVAELVKIR